MKILGIDTSCDDTCVSVLKIENCKLKIESNVVSSQVKLHQKYGGVYPMLAKREHQKNLPLVFKQVLRLASLAQGKLDFIGVTVGPGLEPCLWQGVNFAKNLAGKLKKPLIPVNHIEAHILANFLGSNFQFLISNFQTLFPAVCLVVSGGHTQLILMKEVGKYQLIGETRDDAAGECFDKTARILGLGYPGGPVIAEQARQYGLKIRTSLSERTLKASLILENCKLKIVLPRPMMYAKNYDFSFSGLKTAVLYEFKKQPAKTRKSKSYIRAICHEIQQSIIDVLIWKTFKAAKDFRAKSIILGGGVAANTELKRQFEEKVKTEIPHFQFSIPDPKFCTDNAAMIALTASFHRKEATKNWQKIKVDANLRI